MKSNTWLSKGHVGDKVIYLCDWLPPDFGAVGQYSLLFSRERAALGQDVLLVGLSSKETSVTSELVGNGRLTIWRMFAKPYNKSSFADRLLWTVLVNLRLLVHLILPFTKAREIIFTGSPPFMVHWVSPLCRLLGKKSIYRITDFYPECLMAEKDTVSLPLRLLHWLTVFWRKRVSVMEILGEDQRRRLHEVGISDSRIQMKRDPSPISIPDDTKPLEVPESLRGYVVLLYSGNFGVAHDYETFVDGYIRHHREGNGRVGFWLNAVGASAAVVEARLRDADVPYHRSSPVPLEQLPNLLVTPDVHLITLKDAFVGYVMPSKVYGCINSKRRILYIGSKDSDVELLCRRDTEPEKYSRVDVDDIDAVARVLDGMAELGTSDATSVT